MSRPLAIAIIAGSCLVAISINVLIWRARYDVCRSTGSSPVICFFAASGR